MEDKGSFACHQANSLTSLNTMLHIVQQQSKTHLVLYDLQKIKVLFLPDDFDFFFFFEKKGSVKLSAKLLLRSKRKKSCEKSRRNSTLKKKKSMTGFCDVPR